VLEGGRLFKASPSSPKISPGRDTMARSSLKKMTCT
jgi:hypothetical protein